MEVVKYPEKEDWARLLERPDLDYSALYGTVEQVLKEIKAEGDEAVIRYSEKFDKVKLSSIQVSDAEMEHVSIDESLKNAINLAADNIYKFHKAQEFKGETIETSPGVKCWQKAVAIEKVGLYIPGGTAPLFSTVLMLGIPAKIAGCREIILCTPPDKNGSIHPAILYAAAKVGVTKLFKVGGIQAIGAMAYGTESVPKVYKIFGPGNQYVTAAKQIVSLKDVAIDMPAGPSEVEVIADASSNPDFIASDLLSQAEHGATSQVVMVTDDASIISPVQKALEAQLKVLPREEMARKAIANSRIILVKDQEEVIEITNAYAPEHLIISTDSYAKIADRVINAGSVFLGQYTPESAGDYASGTNHTLPTNGYATAYSGVNLDSYVKKITFQEISPEGLQIIGPAIETMAENEELFAHKNAVTLRLKEIGK